MNLGGIGGNGWAMISTGLKIKKFSDLHLAKAFYFVFIFFILKAKSKDLADLVNIHKLWIKH